MIAKALARDVTWWTSSAMRRASSLCCAILLSLPPYYRETLQNALQTLGEPVSGKRSILCAERRGTRWAKREPESFTKRSLPGSRLGRSNAFLKAHPRRRKRMSSESPRARGSDERAPPAGPRIEQHSNCDASFPSRTFPAAFGRPSLDTRRAHRGCDLGRSPPGQIEGRRMVSVNRRS